MSHCFVCLIKRCSSWRTACSCSFHISMYIVHVYGMSDDVPTILILLSHSFFGRKLNRIHLYTCATGVACMRYRCATSEQKQQQQQHIPLGRMVCWCVNLVRKGIGMSDVRWNEAEVVDSGRWIAIYILSTYIFSRRLTAAIDAWPILVVAQAHQCCTIYFHY